MSNDKKPYVMSDDERALGKGPLRGPASFDRTASSESLLAPDDEMTPRPQVIPPEMTDRQRARVTSSPVLAAAITSADVPQPVQRALNEFRGIVGEVMHTLDTYRESLHEVQRGIDQLWPLRHAHDLMFEMSRDLATLKESMRLLGPDAEQCAKAIDDLRATVEDLDRTIVAAINERDHKLDELRRQVWGDKGRAPDDKPLAVEAKRGSRLVQYLCASAIAGMGAAAVLLWQAATSTADMKAKVQHLEDDAHRRDEQLLLLFDKLGEPRKVTP